MTQSRKTYFSIFIFLFVSFVLNIQCIVDHGLNPLQGRIKGKITFQNRTNDVLNKTDEIRVAVAKSFPPTEFTELITTGPLPKWEGDTIHYELVVPFGTYNILGVVWKGKSAPWNLSDILGYYREGLDLLPTPIEVTKEKPTVEPIDLYADFKLVIREALVTGTIFYEGDWPEETEITGIGAFKEPPNPNNIFSLLSVSSAKIGIPIFVSSYNYNLPIGAGVYKYIGLFWKAKNKPFTDLRYLGFYADPGSPDLPGTITVAKGDTLRNIDMNINFNTIEF